MKRVLLCLTFILLQACVQGDLESPVKATPAILLQPSISSISPLTGSSNGNETLTISGSDFEAGATVSVDGLPCSITSLTIDKIECLTPPHSAGTVAIRVKNANALDDEIINQFTYQTAPYTASVSPTSGPTAGSTAITITGNHFMAGASVTVAGSNCASTVIVNSSTITCVTPASTAGLRNIVVTNPDLLTGTIVNGFNFISPPNLTTVSTPAGALGGGTNIILLGTNFSNPVTSVDIGGSPCTITAQNSTSINCTTTANTVGSKAITVTNSDSQTSVLAGGFEYRPAPTFTSVTPTAGALAGGSLISIVGTNFDTVNPMTVTVGGNTCTGITVVSATNITCTLPAGSLGGQNIIIYTASQSVTAAGAYTYNNAPVISYVTLNAGPLAGGNTVSIVGNNFLAGAVATIGGTPCAGPTITPTNITCPIPAGVYAAASVNVVVTNLDTQSVTLVNGYTFRGAPTVTSISPNAGALAGGTSVTVTGTGFVTGAAVQIGVVSCASVNVVSSTTLTCTTTAQGAGNYNITVTNLDTQNGTLATSYTYQAAPTVGSISPTAGPLAAGTTITITGANFVTGLTATVGGIACTSPTYVSPTSMTCVSPTLVSGDHNVVVTNTTQSGSLANAYSARPTPTITSVNPTAGSNAGATSLIIYGTNFYPGMSITVGGTACAATSIISSSILSCITPAGTVGARNVVVTNLPDNQAATGVGIYTYALAPTIASVLPAGGPLGGGTTITVSGTNFIASSTITVDGNACPTTFVNTSTLTCVTPASAPATVNVVVTNVSQTVTAINAFTYQSPPIIGAVVPNGGSLSGGNTVAVNGVNFLAASQVTIGGTACAPTTFVSSTQLNCTIPAGVYAASSVNVVVDNQDSQTHTLANGYSFRPAPTLTSIAPNAGALAGGTLITITGTGFVTGATATVDGAPCTSPTVVNSTTLTCTTIAHVAGTVNAVVLNTDGQLGTGVGVYTYQDAPTYTSITPIVGAVIGGTPVVITGTNFDTVNTPTVLIGGSACTGVTTPNANTINCTTSAHAAGVANIDITNVSQSVSSASVYTYQEAPTITSVTMNTGTVNGGNTVKIIGTYFISGATVTIGGNACDSVTFNSSTDLDCVVNTGAAPHAPGATNVVVTNPDTQFVTSVGGYTFQNAPAIASVLPTAGFATGGMTITLTGTDFVAGATVTIGGSACNSVNVLSSTTITCVTPAHASGTVSIIVQNADTQSATLPASFTFQAAPTIASITPSGGTISGLTPVSITGTNFYAGATVSIGGAACNTVNVVSSTNITCITSASAAGTYNIDIQNTDLQSGTLALGYTYSPAPTITLATPSTGKSTGGDTITLSGLNIVAGATITLDQGGTPAVCGAVNFINSTSIQCVTAAHASGPVDITLTNPDGQNDTINLGFIYLDPPTVASSAPASGFLSGGTAITVTGTNFYPGASVLIGANACTSVTVHNSTTLGCTTPAGVTGLNSITVTNPDGQAATTGSLFTYVPPPSISTITPNRGALAGGGTIVIAGAAFSNPVTSVTLDGVACPVVAETTTSITCTVPGHAAADVNVVVTNSDTQSTTVTNGYTYAAAPTVTSVSPSSGSTAGGTNVSVNGTDFVAGATVTLGGSSCTPVSVISANQITCVTTGPNAGAVTAVVTNPDTQTGNLAAAFTYTAPPVITTVSPASGSVAGGTTLTITGTGFVGSTVKIGGNDCTVPVVTPTSITCTIPANATAGAYSVDVTNGDGQIATLGGGYTYASIARLEFQVGATSPNPPNPDSYGSTSINVSHTYTIQNTGDISSSAIATSITGANPTVVLVGTDTCNGAILAAGASCTIQLTFLGAFFPTGAYSGTIQATATTGGTTTNDFTGSVP